MADWRFAMLMCWCWYVDVLTIWCVDDLMLILICWCDVWCRYVDVCWRLLCWYVDVCWRLLCWCDVWCWYVDVLTIAMLICDVCWRCWCVVIFDVYWRCWGVVLLGLVLTRLAMKCCHILDYTLRASLSSIGITVSVSWLLTVARVPDIGSRLWWSLHC